MNQNKYLIIIAATSILSWLGWTLVIFKINPENHVAIGLSLFFLTLFISLSSSLTLIGYFLRKWLDKEDDFQYQINTAFRQGILLALIVLLCIVFKILDVLNWATIISLLVLILFLEFYFAAKASNEQN